MTKLKENKRRLIPRYAVLPLLSVLVMNFVTYYLTSCLTAARSHVQMALPLDARVPFVPAFIVVYILAYGQWGIGYVLIARESEAVGSRILSGEILAKAMPKFSYDYGIEMSEALKALGMTVPFDAELADFSGLGHSSDGNIYISCVLHKAYIAVDEKGTKAGAATAIEAPAAGVWEDRRRVILDRPFVYAIIDDATGLPIFIGAVTDIQK